MWQWPREGSAVGLERRVGPIALILHLEEVAFHLQPRGDAGRGDFIGDAADVEERLVRRDVARKAALIRGAVRVLDRTSAPGTLGDGMQDADADAIPLEVGLCHAVKGELNAPLRIAGDGALPEVVDAPALAHRVEGETE